MNNSLSLTDQTVGAVDLSRGIPLPPARTASLMGYMVNHLEAIPGSFRRYALSAAVAPNDEQKAALIARRNLLDAGLEGCDAITIREQVGTLRSVMASQQLGPEGVKLAKAAFVTVLGRYPAWAVTEACGRFLDGRAGGSTYAPTPGEIAALCRTLTADALHERAVINSILDAEVYAVPTDDDRRKVDEMHAAFVKEATERAAKVHQDNAKDRAATTAMGSAAAERAKALADLAACKAKREADEQSSLSEQLKAGREPFVASERKGEAA